jgi:hypothetical protein
VSGLVVPKVLEVVKIVSGLAVPEIIEVKVIYRLSCPEEWFRCAYSIKMMLIEVCSVNHALGDS